MVPEGIFVRFASGTALTSQPARRGRRELTGRRGDKNNGGAVRNMKSLACSVAVSVGLTSLSMGLTMLQQRAWRTFRLRQRRRERQERRKKIAAYVSTFFGGARPRLVLGSVMTMAPPQEATTRLSI